MRVREFGRPNGPALTDLGTTSVKGHFTRAEAAMQLEDVTFAMFAACNAIRLVAYLPQIHKAAKDLNGASSVSCTTWTLFLLGHLSTVAYALVNRSDWVFAACFASNAVCCIAILAVVNWKRRNYPKAIRKALEGRRRCSCFFERAWL